MRINPNAYSLYYQALWFIQRYMGCMEIILNNGTVSSISSDVSSGDMETSQHGNASRMKCNVQIYTRPLKPFSDSRLQQQQIPNILYIMWFLK